MGASGGVKKNVGMLGTARGTWYGMMIVRSTSRFEAPSTWSLVANSVNLWARSPGAGVHQQSQGTTRTSSSRL